MTAQILSNAKQAFNNQSFNDLVDLVGAFGGEDNKLVGTNTNFDVNSAKSANDILQIERDWNAEQARLAYERSVDFEKHKYKYWVDSLKEAGLNPILATGLGGSVSSPSSAYSGFSNLESSRESSRATKYSADKNLVAQVASSSISAVGNVLSSLVSGLFYNSAAKIAKGSLPKAVIQGFK